MSQFNAPTEGLGLGPGGLAPTRAAMSPLSGASRMGPPSPGSTVVQAPQATGAAGPRSIFANSANFDSEVEQFRKLFGRPPNGPEEFGRFLAMLGEQQSPRTPGSGTATPATPAQGGVRGAPSGGGGFLGVTRNQDVNGQVVSSQFGIMPSSQIKPQGFNSVDGAKVLRERRQRIASEKEAKKKGKP